MVDTPEQRKLIFKKLIPPLGMIVFGILLMTLGFGVLKVDAIAGVGVIAMFGGLIYLFIVGLIISAKRDVGEVSYPTVASTADTVNQPIPAAPVYQTNSISEVNTASNAPGTMPPPPIPVNSELTIKVYGRDVTLKQARIEGWLTVLGTVLGSITALFVVGSVSVVVLFLGISGAVPYFIAIKRLKKSIRR